MSEASSRTPTAVLFADISGSVAIYADRGDTVAFRLNDACLSLLEESVKSHGGRLIKRAGDAILAEFDAAEEAVTAALEMLGAVAAPESGLRNEGIHVRVGISYGTVVHSEGDIYGDRVNIAARLVALAGPGEVLLSGSVYEVLSMAMQESAQRIDQIALRGHSTPIPVFRCVQHGSDQTVSSATLRPASRASLKLTFAERVFAIDASHPKLRIGRSEDNDLMIADAVVSRHHVEIAMRGDKFFLVDRSTNGTEVVVEDGPPMRVCREEIALVGSGRIVLGGKQANLLEYEITER